MRESMRSTEAKYIPDGESSEDSDSGSDSSKDSDSSDDIVYVEKPKKILIRLDVKIVIRS